MPPRLLPSVRSVFLSTRSTLVLLLTVAALFAVSAPARADEVRGRVLDPQDRPVAGADVLIARGTTVVATARTSTDGTFGSLVVPAGEYSISVAATGLRAAPQTLSVEAGSPSKRWTCLTLAAVSESVIVRRAGGHFAITPRTASQWSAARIPTWSNSLRVMHRAGFGVVRQASNVVTSFLRGSGSTTRSCSSTVSPELVRRLQRGASDDAGRRACGGHAGPQVRSLWRSLDRRYRTSSPDKVGRRARMGFEASGYGTTHESASVAADTRSVRAGRRSLRDRRRCAIRRSPRHA